MQDPSKRNYLVARLTEGYYDHFRSVAPQTWQKQSGNFVRWQKFLEKCDINDEFLDSFHEREKIAVMQAFTASLRRNVYGR